MTIDWENDSELIDRLKTQYGTANAYECCGERTCTCGRKYFTGYLMPRWEYFYYKLKTGT